MKRKCIQIDLMAITPFLLLLVLVFIAGKKDEFSIKKESAISCGPVQPANEHNSWPTDDNSGNGCTHQTVSAAFFGRVKRDKPHSC